MRLEQQAQRRRPILPLGGEEGEGGSLGPRGARAGDRSRGGARPLAFGHVPLAELAHIPNEPEPLRPPPHRLARHPVLARHVEDAAVVAGEQVAEQRRGRGHARPALEPLGPPHRRCLSGSRVPFRKTGLPTPSSCPAICTALQISSGNLFRPPPSRVRLHDSRRSNRSVRRTISPRAVSSTIVMLNCSPNSSDLTSARRRVPPGLGSRNATSIASCRRKRVALMLRTPSTHAAPRSRSGWARCRPRRPRAWGTRAAPSRRGAAAPLRSPRPPRRRPCRGRSRG